MAKANNVLTTGDVAKICTVSVGTVYKWFDKALLAGYRIPGSRDRRIPIAELARFMAVNKIPIPESCPALKTAVRDLPKRRRRTYGR